MGVNYYVIPIGQQIDVLDDTLREESPWLANEIQAEGGLAAWSARRGVMLPEGATSRFPTFREVATVVQGLAGLRYQILLRWLNVFTYLDDSEHTYIASDRFKGKLDEPWPFFFHKGSADLARFLTARIAVICGPLLFQPDYETDLELIVPNRSYRATSGFNGGTLVQWTNPLPQYASRAMRLLPFSEQEDKDNYEGLPAFVSAHGIPFPHPVASGHRLTRDDLLAALADRPAYQTVFHQDIWTKSMTADVYKGAIDADHLFTSVYFESGWPYETLFTGGKLIAHVTIAEVIARHFGPYVLLPSHLSPVPILVQAGDHPDRLLSDWEQRTRALNAY